MELIQHADLSGGAQGTITFSSIPQTFTDLVLFYSLRNTTNTNYLTLYFNGVTTSFSQRELQGEGSSGTVYTTARTNSNLGTTVVPDAATAGIHSVSKITIPQYTSSFRKSFLVEATTENNSSLAYQMIIAGRWTTPAITSIQLTSPAQFAQYGSATLYGVLAGNDGTTTVS